MSRKPKVKMEQSSCFGEKKKMSSYVKLLQNMALGTGRELLNLFRTGLIRLFKTGG